MVKNPSAMQETQVQSLAEEDPPEKEMATHSSILAWRIPWTEEPGGAIPWSHKRVGQDLATKNKPQCGSYQLSVLILQAVSG